MFFILGSLFCVLYAIHIIIKVNSDPDEEERIENINDLYRHLDGGIIFFGIIFSKIAIPIVAMILFFNVFFYVMFEIKKHRDKKSVEIKNSEKQREAIIKRLNENLGIDD